MQDYSRFIALFKWGAIISFIVAIFVLFLIA
ncbi:MAG: aa3-type cytochrome c oxidase subunit IV [Sphingomonas sp.]|nr:aa3-type cytochrome c oxidase subunit IV [Sphingomonas sp.]